MVQYDPLWSLWSIMVLMIRNSWKDGPLKDYKISSEPSLQGLSFADIFLGCFMNNCSLFKAFFWEVSNAFELHYFLGEFFSLSSFQNYCETFPCFFVRGIKCLCTGNCQLLSLLLSTPLKGEICLLKVIISKPILPLKCDFDDVGAVVIFC